ncbi:MAG: response regulator [Acidimicrobiales bacterium]
MNGGPRLVIAEDEAIIRLDLVEMLSDEGYDVVADTGDGDEAMRLVRAHRPDLVLVDIKMPGRDGLDVAREVHAEALCGVLVLTAFSQRELVAEATASGALAYLVKPFERAELVAAVEVALARHAEIANLLGEARELTERLETRKVVDRAKGLLMDEHGMREAEAFSFMQKTAMAQRRTMRVVAADILVGDLRP